MAVDTISGFHKHVKDIQDELTNAIAPIIDQLEVPSVMRLSSVNVRTFDVSEIGKDAVRYALGSVELSFDIDVKRMEM